MVEPLFRYASPYSTQVEMTDVEYFSTKPRAIYYAEGITYLFPRKSTTGTRQPLYLSMQDEPSLLSTQVISTR